MTCIAERHRQLAQARLLRAGRRLFMRLGRCSSLIGAPALEPRGELIPGKVQAGPGNAAMPPLRRAESSRRLLRGPDTAGSPRQGDGMSDDAMPPNPFWQYRNRAEAIGYL